MKKYNTNDLSIIIASQETKNGDVGIAVQVGSEQTIVTMPKKLIKANITDNGITQVIINYLIKEK